jgi:hypothetical protein
MRARARSLEACQEERRYPTGRLTGRFIGGLPDGMKRPGRLAWKNHARAFAQRGAAHELDRHRYREAVLPGL